MAAIDTGKVIRKVRHRLELSQEGLSRLMNSTKGAVQHWERGRNIPSLGRLLALRQLCPRSPERSTLDALIHQAQNGVGPGNSKHLPIAMRSSNGIHSRLRLAAFPPPEFRLMQRENGRLQRHITKLESALKRRVERVRILENLATDLQREMARLRAGRQRRNLQST
ncbi:MAG TPA: helix-turn-helix transcriptional regulator [Terriglobia bacterium]|nr:helix-turn-helix transcriptional regulator [Terriglobia bacterium]